MSATEKTPVIASVGNLQDRENGAVDTIDMTPTWGEIGLLFWRLALSGEQAAIREMRGEFAKAFAGMEVLSKIMSTLTPEQRAVFDAVWKVEQAKVLR